MTDGSRKDIGAIIRDGTAIDRAIERAQRRVVVRHRQLGLPLVVWKDGRVVEISPWSVVLPDDEPGPRQAP